MNRPYSWRDLSLLRYWYVTYSVSSGPLLTFSTKAHNAEEAVENMREQFQTGDMLNAPAWHQVSIISAQEGDPLQGTALRRVEKQIRPS